MTTTIEKADATLFLGKDEDFAIKAFVDPYGEGPLAIIRFPGSDTQWTVHRRGKTVRLSTVNGTETVELDES